MKTLQFLDKNKIIEVLNKQFGIQSISGIFVKKGGERIFLFQGDLNEKEIHELEESRIQIERTGIYFGKYVDSEQQFRLSIDGVHLIKDQVTKNILEIDKEQFEKWIKGEEIENKLDVRGFVIIKYKDDFLGCGKASYNKITNFIPKNRRLKDKE